MLPNDAQQEDGSALYKDAVLNEIAPRANVAQFISFSPNLAQRFAWIRGREPNDRFGSIEDACQALLSASESHALNIRSFKPGATKGNRLIENIDSVGEAVSALANRASNGFYTIANELIPLDDGGVSGVAASGVIEFAPGDTPKCVDKPEVTSLPVKEGTRLLEVVYGFGPDIGRDEERRIEFSLHPIRRGFRREHTIIWEIEPSAPVRRAQIGRWPNRFSKFLGDKAYGLLIGHILGFAVPKTIVFARRVAPFMFGEDTQTREPWLRTCPKVPNPGKYPTIYGWTDPFALMTHWDPSDAAIASIIAQESVNFVWSGAALTTEHGPNIEGTEGRGDPFMVAAASRQPVPPPIQYQVAQVHRSLVAYLGAVKFEWVWDGGRVWLVQLHNRRRGISEDVIYPGETDEQRIFDPRLYDREEVLEHLRELIAEIAGKNIGVIVTGDVGVTSHLGDILSEARIPSRLKWWDADEPVQQLALELS